MAKFWPKIRPYTFHMQSTSMRPTFDQFTQVTINLPHQNLAPMISHQRADSILLYPMRFGRSEKWLFAPLWDLVGRKLEISSTTTDLEWKMEEKTTHFLRCPAQHLKQITSVSEKECELTSYIHMNTPYNNQPLLCNYLKSRGQVLNIAEPLLVNFPGNKDKDSWYFC